MRGICCSAWTRGLSCYIIITIVIIVVILVLKFIFNVILSQDTFVTLLKQATIFLKSKRSSVDSYRTTSFLMFFCKVFIHIIL
jgi:hypothetical protein